MAENKQIVETKSATEIMNTINAALDRIDLIAQHPEIAEELHLIFKHAAAATQGIRKLEATLKDAEVYIDRVEAERDEAMTQRDAIADELHHFIRDMTRGEFWNNHTAEEIYEAAVQQHNEAFWMSLPYDMANVLGGDWQFFDADLLHDVLMTDDIEYLAEGRGIPVKVLERFRQNLLAMIRALRELEGSDA